MNRKLITLLLALMVTFGVSAQSFTAKKKVAEHPKAKLEKMSQTSEKSPFGVNLFSLNNKAQWDVIFSLNTKNGGEQAVETDGQYLYTAMWQTSGMIRKYDKAGNALDSFTIVGVAAGIRDLCYDGTYFYGRAGGTSTSIYKMDFVNKTLVATIAMGGKTVRHLSYDPTLDGGNGGFWTGDWATLSSHKLDGTVIATVTPPAAFANVYGATFDGTSVGGPYLWAFTQAGAANPKVVLVKYKIADNTIAETYDAQTTIPGLDMTNAIAGGLGGSSTLEAGKFVLLVNVQQSPNKIVCYEIATTAPATAPNVATALTVTPDAGGALSAVVAWTNPSINTSGAALTDLDSVILFVDDVKVYKNTSPTIGAPESQTITIAAGGNHTFKVVGYNDAGAGLPTSASKWVGNDAPSAPTAITLTKTGMDANLSWTAPTTGLHGGYLAAAGITYNVYRMPANTLVSTAQTGTTFTETIASPGSVSYKVVASNAVGEGGNATSNTLTFGNFLIFEEFPTVGAIPAGWASNGLGLTNWSVAAGTNAGGVTPQLKFNYSPSFTGRSNFMSPVVNTTGMASLTLEFKHMIDWYTHTAAQKFGVATTTDGGTTWTEVWSIDPTANVAAETKTLVIENANVGSANFQLAFFFEGASLDMDYWYIDNVTLVKNAGAQVTFTVNDGTNPIAGANIEIGTKNFTTDASGVAAAGLPVGVNNYTITKFGFEDKTGSVTVVDGVPQAITVSMTALTAFDITFNVKNNIPANIDGAIVTAYNGVTVVAKDTTVAGVAGFTDVPVGNYTYDIVADGYVSVLAQPITVSKDTTLNITLLENIQTPFGLQWTSVGLPEGDVLFSWNNVQEFVDDFESYDDFVLTFGEWTLNDVDGKVTYGFNGATFTNSGAAMAGIIFNPSQVAPAITTSPAHSGDKYVATFNPDDASACNDWIISPKTMVAPNGEVSFWARGGNAQYSTEKFQVFVSTTNTDPTSFTSITPIVTCAASSVEWVEYTYSLSAYVGQEVYVGIQVTSVDQFYFCLDDFRIGAPTKNAKAATGYNVYLDNTTTPVASNVAGTNYTFNTVTPGAHTAYVEAVYATGVSAKASLVIDYVGLGENNKPSIVSVFPNPAKNMINVNATSNIISVKVVNVLGALVINEKVDAAKANINVSNLDNGIYYITIETANGVSTQKINVVK